MRVAPGSLLLQGIVVGGPGTVIFAAGEANQVSPGIYRSEFCPTGGVKANWRSSHREATNLYPFSENRRFGNFPVFKSRAGLTEPLFLAMTFLNGKLTLL
jgi:hypothetical protein